MPEVADVFRRYGPDYRERFGEGLLPSHRRAMDDIVHCRTEALGGHLLQCDQCGHEHYVYHSCRNRSCPRCHRLTTEAWLEERRQELLPVSYFHVVFTVPHELGEIIRRHQQDLYDILFRAASQSLIKLAADPHPGLSSARALPRPGRWHLRRPDAVAAGPLVLPRARPCPVEALSWAVSGLVTSGTA
jgi:hypothetical protein